MLLPPTTAGQQILDLSRFHISVGAQGEGSEYAATLLVTVTMRGAQEGNLVGTGGAQRVLLHVHPCQPDAAFDARQSDYSGVAQFIERLITLKGVSGDVKLAQLFS